MHVSKIIEELTKTFALILNLCFILINYILDSFHNIQEVLVLLEQIPLRLRQHFRFIHNGTPTSFNIKVRNQLNTLYTNHWIGRGGTKHWPARSPDINLPDFCFRIFEVISLFHSRWKFWRPKESHYSWLRNNTSICANGTINEGSLVIRLRELIFNMCCSFPSMSLLFNYSFHNTQEKPVLLEEVHVLFIWIWTALHKKRIQERFPELNKELQNDF